MARITPVRLAKAEKAKEKRLSSPSSVKKPAEDVPAQTVAEPTIEYFRPKGLPVKA
jgi:hypothetical protein